MGGGLRPIPRCIARATIRLEFCTVALVALSQNFAKEASCMFSLAKRLFAIAALLIALPVLANAQTSRVEGMALNGDYIKDNTEIYSWPASITNVGNLVYGEFGNSDFPKGSFDRGMGAVLGNLWDGRYGTWAIHMREITPNLAQGDVANGFDPNTHHDQS